MLAVSNITYEVDGKALIKDVSVSFHPGKLNLVIGPNGAGKSTFVRLICNQLKPKIGSVRYGSTPVDSISISDLAKIRAVLSQNIELAFPLTVAEVVMMGRYPHFHSKPTGIDQKACEEAMCFFDIQDFADRNYLTLSGGEKQRVQFARVMAQIWFPEKEHCRYLILDEPLTFLDVRYQFDFMHKLLDLRKKDLVIIAVVHDLNLVSKFADEVVLLAEGKLLASGNKDQVLSKENIKKAYHLDPVIHVDNGKRYLFFE
ncbi:MAG TPA: heme ABC transporter ATP-binding protein [Bacteroidia bacterium]|jgi:iron complex transport system ATP-binding protein|nr:heme ABC transporter ATP-binding protein [Bacteroidia bacterium]